MREFLLDLVRWLEVTSLIAVGVSSVLNKFGEMWLCQGTPGDGDAEKRGGGRWWMRELLSGRRRVAAAAVCGGSGCLWRRLWEEGLTSWREERARI